MRRIPDSVTRIIDAMPDGLQKRNYSGRVTKIRGACGCKTGALFLILAAIGYPLIAYFFSGRINLSIAYLILGWPLACIFSAVFGKLAGLAWAKADLFILSRELSKQKGESNA